MVTVCSCLGMGEQNREGQRGEEGSVGMNGKVVRLGARCLVP